VCKVRGITFNYNAPKIVTFDVITYMILRGNTGDEISVLNVHTDKETKSKRLVRGIVSIVRKPKVKV